MGVPQTYRPWTKHELELLQANHNMTINELAEWFGRSKDSIISKLYYLRHTQREVVRARQNHSRKRQRNREFQQLRLLMQMQDKLQTPVGIG